MNTTQKIGGKKHPSFYSPRLRWCIVKLLRRGDMTYCNAWFFVKRFLTIIVPQYPLSLIIPSGRLFPTVWFFGFGGRCIDGRHTNRKLTWPWKKINNLKMYGPENQHIPRKLMVGRWNILLKWYLFRGHVNFWAGYLLLKMVNCHVSFRAVYVRGCLLRLTFWWCWQVSHLAMPFFGWCCRREVIRGLHFYYTPRTVWCEPPLTNRAFARDFVGKWPRLKHRPAKNSHEPRKNPSYFPIIHCLKIPESQPFAHEIIQKIWANSRSTNYIT